MEPEKHVQERSRVTRAALLDAAIDCLVERGYGATTTIETARRAGVSRGAQLHHFPTKAQLLTAAVEHLLERRIVEFRKAFADVDEAADPLDSAIDLLWTMFEGQTFVAWVELWIGARTDGVLASAVVEMDRRFAEASHALVAELFPSHPGDEARVSAIGRDFAFALMEGVAFGRLVADATPRPAADYIEVLKRVAHAMETPRDAG